MPNALRWRALVVVVVIAGAAALALSRPARLGLDLRGGTQIVLEAQDTDRVKVDGDVASRTLEVLRGASTRWAWPNRRCSARVSGASSSSCPA